jgi:hypothetical protein
MDRKPKIIILTLCLILFLEWIGLLALVYFARLPEFIALFVAFVRLFSPWFIGFNIVFLVFTLFTKGIKFTWEFWRDYIKELLRFFTLSFIITAVVIVVSTVLGARLGIFADRISALPTIKEMQQWVAEHFY